MVMEVTKDSSTSSQHEDQIGYVNQLKQRERQVEIIAKEYREACVSIVYFLKMTETLELSIT